MHAEETHEHGAASLEHDEEGTSQGAPSDGRVASGRFAWLWIVAAGLCLFAAAICLLRGMLNAAFVLAVLGVAAWFLNIRAGLQRSIATEIMEEEDEDEDSLNANV